MSEKKYMLREVEAVKTLPKKFNIADQIQYFNLDATKQDVSDWQSARLDAIDVNIPDWTDLIRVYDDVIVDSHLTGIIESIKDRIKATPFELVNENGERDDRTELFEKKWFFKLLDWAVESMYYPYSLVQLGKMIDNGFPEIELIKREYVIPNRNFIKESLNVYGTYKTGVDGWNYTDPKISPYYIMMKAPIELGLLDRVASHALGKKHMLIYLWKYVELYGSPARVGKTDLQDPDRRKNMELMLQNYGNSLWALMDKDGDDLELKGTTGGSSSGEPHLKAIDKANSEMSKALMGTDSVMDEKSFVGSAEVGERIFETKGTGILRMIKFIVNDELLPRMLYYTIPVQGLTFRWINEDKITFEQKLELIKTLAPYFELNEEEISELGFNVQKKQNITHDEIIQAVKSKSKSVVADVNKMYNVISK